MIISGGQEVLRMPDDAAHKNAIHVLRSLYGLWIVRGSMYCWSTGLGFMVAA